MSIINSTSRKSTSLDNIMPQSSAFTHTESSAAGSIPTPVVPLKRGGLNLRLSERRLVLAFVDIILVNLALIIAVVAYSDVPLTFNDLLGAYKWFVALTLVWYLSAQFFDCYSLARSASAAASIRNITLAAVIAVVVYTFIPFVTPQWGQRSVFFLQLTLTIVFVVAWRMVYAQVFIQPWFQQRVLVVGAGKAGRALATALQSAPTTSANPYRGTGYQILGFIDDAPEHRGEVIAGVPVLGDHHALAQVARQLRVNEIVLAITHRHAIEDDLFDALLNCRELGFRIVTMATVYERLTGRVPIDHVGRDLEMVVPMDDNAGERAYKLFKRTTDIVSAIVGLALMAVLCVPIAIINARTSPGNLFYKQRRIGQGGRIFEVYKFRSMRPDAEKGTGAVWAKKNDDRITPAGRFLRKTRLDEMPQFINILRGEMSLIGPRPERPEFVNALALMLPFYRARHAVKPGLTGWAQIRYGYGSTNEDSHAKLEYDLYYVKHASPLLDVIIMLQTLPVMLLGKGQ